MGSWRLEHTYGTLPALFHSRAEPTPVRSPELLYFNAPLGTRLGLDVETLDSPAGAAIFGGNALPAGAAPLAQAYAGHQFGHFTSLGDGRAILLGEQVAPDGLRFDIQLKGAGPTVYSRRGDGRAAVGPMLRELIISEAMHGLGIPTTRSLAVVATGERVHRERPLPGAVLTRVASSHLRIGTFQWAAAHRDEAALRALCDYTIGRHYPDAAHASNPALALFEAIVSRQAALIAQWQLVGFVHGVMNTDNMSLAGETIDYGPCAFMDTYDPATVFSSIDAQGRYAYGNQPAIAEWNLARLAEAMLPLFASDRPAALSLAQGALERFAGQFQQQWLRGMRSKLGLFTEESDDEALVDAVLTWMLDARRDYTDTFRLLSVADVLPDDIKSQPWALAWMNRLGRQPQSRAESQDVMRRHNPALIARNHKVEEALTYATDGDLQPMRRLVDALAAPFDHDRAALEFTAPPDGSGRPYRTFCGT